MMSAADEALILVGPMAAGKTSIGRAVARMLGVPFHDSDRRIVAEHGPIPAIFETHGEARFRELERAAVAELVAAGGVVSLGGGAVTDAATRALLRDRRVVFLTVSADAVAERIRGGGRPLLEGEEDPVARWERILRERRAWYEEVSDVSFDTSRVPMQRVAEEIVAWLRGQSG